MSVKILVVDDNDMNRMLVKDVLEGGGYEILEAKDGREGVAVARERLPNLILMDVQMPIMNGFAAAKILKSDATTKNIKIVLLTAYAGDAVVEEFLLSGIDDYLAKPLDIHLLSEKVSRHIGAR